MLRTEINLEKTHPFGNIALYEAIARSFVDGGHHKLTVVGEITVQREHFYQGFGSSGHGYFTPYGRWCGVIPARDYLWGWFPQCNGHHHRYRDGTERSLSIVWDARIVIDAGEHALPDRLVLWEEGGEYLTGHGGGRDKIGYHVSGLLEVEIRDGPPPPEGWAPGRVPALSDLDLFDCPGITVVLSNGMPKAASSNLRVKVYGKGTSRPCDQGLVQLEDWGRRWRLEVEKVAFPVHLYGHVDTTVEGYLKGHGGTFSSVVFGDHRNLGQPVFHRDSARGQRVLGADHCSQARFNRCTIEGAIDHEVVSFGGVRNGTCFSGCHIEHGEGPAILLGAGYDPETLRPTWEGGEVTPHYYGKWQWDVGLTNTTTSSKFAALALGPACQKSLYEPSCIRAVDSKLTEYVDEDGTPWAYYVAPEATMNAEIVRTSFRRENVLLPGQEHHESALERARAQPVSEDEERWDAD